MAVILVVDDHPHILRLLQRELEAEAHDVITATTGEEALRKINEERPALVVLDVMLPGKSGLSVLRELRADPATEAMVVILLTAQDQPSDVTQGLQRGADWYVTKPFRPGDIATLVRRFLDHRPAPATVAQSSGDRLPNGEIDQLTMTAAEAFDLAVRGNVIDGYDCLSAGLRRADAARAAGRPWAEELALSYQELRDHYVARYRREECAAALACP
jgi:DNA-binding response OmpR family regulator